MSELEAVARLSRDLAIGAKTLSEHEARFLVDAYYMMQESRIRTGHQKLQLDKSSEPHAVLQWLMKQNETLEGQVKRALTKYAEEHPKGQWPMSIVGIGPVITAGLLAHIDIKKAPTVGHIWRFAGLDPTMKWEKKTKRPWNASLKTLCWKIGESFVKVSNNEDSFYGLKYKERKALEISRNEAGIFKEQAERALQEKKYGKETKARAAYESGKLPDAHIHARAKRYAVKLFLAHLHEVWYKIEFGKDPPLPYPIAHMGHVHIIGVPES